MLVNIPTDGLRIFSNVAHAVYERTRASSIGCIDKAPAWCRYLNRADLQCISGLDRELTPLDLPLIYPTMAFRMLPTQHPRCAPVSGYLVIPLNGDDSFHSFSMAVFTFIHSPWHAASPLLLYLSPPFCGVLSRSSLNYRGLCAHFVRHFQGFIAPSGVFYHACVLKQ